MPVDCSYDSAKDSRFPYFRGRTARLVFQYLPSSWAYCSCEVLSLRKLLDECDGQDVLMEISNAVVKNWFNVGRSRLIDRVEVDTTLGTCRCSEFVRIRLRCSSSHDWFPYKYKARKLSRVSG